MLSHLSQALSESVGHPVVSDSSANRSYRSLRGIRQLINCNVAHLQSKLGNISSRLCNTAHQEMKGVNVLSPSVAL